MKCKKLEESGEWKKENIEVQEVGKNKYKRVVIKRKIKNSMHISVGS